MRIAIDLQPCQTESRWRGIGRYSRDLTHSLLQVGSGHEFILGVDATYPAWAAEVREQFGDMVTDGAFRTYHYPLPTLPVSGYGDALRDAAEALVRHTYAQSTPDVLHVNSLFEGFIEHAAGLGRLADLPGTVSSVTLYDLIPQVLPDWYLVDPVFRDWYRRRLAQVARFDVVLCISEATRRDAMDLLGLPPERVSVINAGVDARLLDPARGRPLDDAMRSRFGIDRRYVMYTGNADPRKNLTGAVQAFARVPAEVRAGMQLVLNQVGDVDAIRRVAHSAGLGDGELVVTGHVGDADLEALLRNCDLFFFPSLYEGFGLPVLEAMACGAPTICADNSSLPEVMGRSDAMFDASSLESTTAKLTHALADEGFRQSLRIHGRERASLFTWDASARLALDAWQAAVERAQVSPVAVPSARRNRVALVTPLPPDQTGIADYVAELLPALAAQMDIEIFVESPETRDPDALPLFRLRDWTELESSLERFDQVVYQMGNSPFHAHMFDLMMRVPGVVVLHDVYLSSLVNYMEVHQGREGMLAAELEYAHGRGAALRLEEPNGRLDAVLSYPCSRRVLECADAIIVHSQHSAETIRNFYPSLDRPSLFVAPMPMALRVPTAERRAQARAVLGLGDEDVLLVSFGFVADTKCSAEILHALASPELCFRPGLHLAFVGGLDGGEYGRKFQQEVDTHPLKANIALAGFASKADYELYLDAADIAVQLRTISRGETSKSILDCLARGIPTVVNDFGSFAEVPDRCVRKIAARVQVPELALAISSLLDSAADRESLAGAACAFIAGKQSPHDTARTYDLAIAQAQAAYVARRGDLLVEELVSSMQRPGADDGSANAIEAALRKVDGGSFTRVYTDVTDIVRTDHATGVQRVVRNVIKELVRSEGQSSRTVPVALDGQSGLVAVPEGAERFTGLPVRPGLDEFAPAIGDVLFLLDSTWEDPARFRGSIDAIRASGGRVYAMVYDLIPQLFPTYCVEFMPRIHANWLRFVVNECDGVVCISKAVADDLIGWIAEHDVPHRQGLRIDFVPLGSDVAERGPDRAAAAVTPRVMEAFNSDEAVHLMVGTLEPRKRHALVLDAFERWWAAGANARLVIIGKPGWNVEPLLERIRRHPESGQRLFWFDRATDADVNFAYANAARVIQASAAEGFGLPLVEAAAHGCPVLASDIPVFREVAGDSAEYFASGDVDALVEALARPVGGSPSVRMATWADCAAALRALFRAPRWRYTLSGKAGNP